MGWKEDEGVLCVCVCETIEHWVTQQQTEGHPNSRMQTQHNPPIFFSTSLLCDKHKQTVHWGSVAVVYHPYGNCVVHGTMVLESTLHKFCIQRQNKKWKHYKIIISHWFSLAMKHEGVPMQFAFNVMNMPLPFLHAPRRPSRPRYGSSIFFFLLHHRMLDGCPRDLKACDFLLAVGCLFWWCASLGLNFQSQVLIKWTEPFSNNTSVGCDCNGAARIECDTSSYFCEIFSIFLGWDH